ncbi:hypothetical protein C1D09_019580 [Mesorhizobium intechi]|uniref:Uncharacterized protein n=1 Tax=Mesorhizobium intechi TaxID=537601 RepID=A0A8T9ANM5_9HYPH|nr:hypothetical protein [Mesorhizobium intechi]TSE07243.1 hypothetical protein C1D09_019580 [Mesorhizobium intechi]
MISNPAIRQYTETLQIANRTVLAGEFTGRNGVANSLENPERNAVRATLFAGLREPFLSCTAIAHIAAHNDEFGRHILFATRKNIERSPPLGLRHPRNCRIENL